MYMHTNNDQQPKRQTLNPKDGRFCLNSNLRKACRAITALYMEAMRESELQGTQFTLLSTIAAFGEVTIGALSEYLVMDQTTVTRSINLLKKADYVEVVVGEDRRVRILRLTEKGERAIETAYPMWLAAQSQVWEQLGDEKAAQLLALTSQIIEIAEQE